MDYHILEIDSFELSNGKRFNIQLSYQLFGQELFTAPIVLVNHSLTGDSNVTGESGWWQSVVGPEHIIDTNHYTILAFNIPGNGFADLDEAFTEYYKQFKAKDIARIFSIGLDQLKIDNLFAIIGGSVGGGLVWELASIRPELADHLVPVAADWKATDWLIANCHIQDDILNHSSQPIEDARKHAMTFYRTPESFTEKFQRQKEADGFKVESWLNHHAHRLQDRFKLSAYKMMNQILKTVQVTDDNQEFINIAKTIRGHIHIITIDSDLLFKSDQNWATFVDLKSVKENVSIGEIKSIHGHDAFLIEHGQLSKLLKPIFDQKKIKNDNNKLSYIRHW